MKTLHISSAGFGRSTKITDDKGNDISRFVRNVHVLLQPMALNEVRLEVLGSLEVDAVLTECTVIQTCPSCLQKDLERRADV